MLFQHATPRPLKAMEAYRVAVMGLHGKLVLQSQKSSYSDEDCIMILWNQGLGMNVSTPWYLVYIFS